MGIMNKMKTVALKDLTWQVSKSNNRQLFICTPSDGKISNNPNVVIKAACDGYIAVTTGKTWVDKDMAYSQSSGSRSITLVNNSFTTVSAFLASEGNKTITYETAESVEEMFISNPTFTYKNSGWGNNWSNIINYLNTLAPGVYDIILRATLTKKKTNFDQGTNKWGIYTSNPTQNLRYTWSTSAQVGDIAERRNTLRVSSTPFANFYVYGCGRDGLGDTGTADIELIIINPYMEVIQ